MADDINENVLDNEQESGGESATTSSLIGGYTEQQIQEYEHPVWHSQAYLATYKSDGTHTPDSARSFISFKYDGKDIEDFNIISVTGGDRISRGLYTSFNPHVSESEVVDGQYYWGYKYNPYEITFTLATDGMLESEMQAFRHHFRPREPKELILAEAPNRKTYARVAAEPQMSMLPFEYPVTKNIGGQEITTSTTLWKGEISLSFIVDEPFWYAINSYYTSPDSENLKVYLEDGIPYSSIFSGQDTILLANNYYYHYSNNAGAITSGAISSFSSATTNLYLYNCGTAPAKPVIEFTFTEDFSSDGYIQFPVNSYKPVEVGNGNAYNCNSIFIIDTSSNICQTFSFTTPGLLTGYNQALDVMERFEEDDSAIELYDAFRDTISEYYIRGRACAIVNDEDIKDSVTGKLKSGFKNKIITKLKAGFAASGGDSYNPITVSFNSKTGVSTIHTYFNVIDVNTSQDTSQEIIENAGDMVVSNYLLLNERTLPINDGISSVNCLHVTTDCSSTLSNFSIDYPYTYL